MIALIIITLALTCVLSCPQNITVPGCGIYAPVSEFFHQISGSVDTCPLHEIDTLTVRIIPHDNPLDHRTVALNSSGLFLFQDLCNGDHDIEVRDSESVIASTTVTVPTSTPVHIRICNLASDQRLVELEGMDTADAQILFRYNFVPEDCYFSEENSLEYPNSAVYLTSHLVLVSCSGNPEAQIQVPLGAFDPDSVVSVFQSTSVDVYTVPDPPAEGYVNLWRVVDVCSGEEIGDLIRCETSLPLDPNILRYGSAGLFFFIICALLLAISYARCKRLNSKSR
eukprot:gnl/Dysnectes_brevis/6245_a9550_367.p1 GENE.gnl/Dysnectes_brevis/6245_a9550_367~~gnl/Dysnectes_brevis/6245_a9550_367.p1  ORF type:complete len:282 (+),score=46.44 gnl/Dysnectes_brevis/6245_a9550_367:168-1013(+)